MEGGECCPFCGFLFVRGWRLSMEVQSKHQGNIFGRFRLFNFGGLVDWEFFGKFSLKKAMDFIRKTRSRFLMFVGWFRRFWKVVTLGRWVGATGRSRHYGQLNTPQKNGQHMKKKHGCEQGSIGIDLMAPPHASRMPCF